MERARWVLRALLAIGASLGVARHSAAAPGEAKGTRPAEAKAAAKGEARADKAPKSADKAPKSADKAPKSAEKAAPKPKSAPDKAEAKTAPKPAARKAEAPKPARNDASSKAQETPPVEAKARVTKVGPQRGAGTRRVEVKGSLPELIPAPAPETSGAKTAHRRGAPPKRPAPSLPPGAVRPVPDSATRRLIAEGAIDEDLRAGKDDPELRSLREAERVLFPQPLPGVEPGWSWNLPKPARPRGPEIVASGLPPEARTAAEPGDEPAAEAAWLSSLALPNLPVRFDEHVVKYLRFYRDSPSGRSIARAWAKKSGRYLPAIKAELAKAGLPTDLAWLSLIESGHNPTIFSPAGAAGLWQFIPESGRTYGLAVDRWVDERLDPERSTQAACRYLSDLYRRFGNWDLAMAGYNMGHAGLSRAIRKFNTNSFWELVRYEAGIPWETTLYVPKILATAIVMSNKRAFGLEGVAQDPPETFDAVLVGPGTPLEDVARAAGVPLSAVERLNPQYLAGRTPPALPGAGKVSWRVRVPAGRALEANRVLAQSSSTESYEAHAVRFGETIESIALARGTTEARLRSLNRVDSKEKLGPGTILLVPKQAESSASPASEPADVVVVPPREFNYPGKRRVFYRVLSGDTVAAIAKAFQVDPGSIVAWNALDETARLHSGMVLQLFVDKRKELSGVRHLEEGAARVLVAGTPEFTEYFEGLNGKRRVVVTAREGDTLLSIGRRYGTSIGWMERINRRSRNDKLRPGETLIVYTNRPASTPQKSEEATLVSALSPIEPPFPEALPRADRAPETAPPSAIGQ